jgi:regulator of protease activity HflC (stomatin/prohibitin superfamily)
MTLIIMFVIFLLAAIFVPKFIPDVKYNRGYDDVQTKDMGWIRNTVRGACVVLAILCFLSMSCFTIDSDSVGHMKRVYFGESMPSGRIIADQNQKGPQANIIAPGFHLMPFIKVTHDIEELPLIEVPEGQYGYLVAKDGRPMPDGQFIASAWENVSDMINAEKFMGYLDESETPLGIKGPQLTVLPPGQYRVNRYLFDVYADTATDVPIGHVAVVKSNVGDHYNGDPILPTGVDKTTLSVPIVPKGHKGVWNEVLRPDRYYLNKKAYDIIIIPTQVQTWKYLGGYERRFIDLTLNDDGKIQQHVRSLQVDIPKDAADGSVLLRVENWDVFQDARIQVQVTPENAPFVVAAAGGISAIEDKIMTPTFRSVLRNEAAKNIVETTEVKGKETKISRPRRVLDLLYKREGLESAVESKLIPEGEKYGLTVMEVRFGDPVVPPELLVPGKRKQLAESLMATYKQEQEAQIKRVESERERARADQQPVLMKSEIGIKVADNEKKARIKRGEGEEAYLKAVANGQRAQATVLGQDRAFELAYVEKILEAAVKNPEIIKYPGTLVMGSTGGFEGAAAILGRSNLNMGLATPVPAVTK